ncbi:SAC3/GANP/Nin1/mts3/eIF-3 p25 family-domain-containing protein, partial [Hysterangium stoloniferum]
GTCMDMCPEFERHEREYQKDVDEWEKIPNTNPKRIDHVRAVKKYRRSAAGNDDPLPSDLRPPAVLKKTLDYLLHTLLPTYGLAATYAFIRDRTRSIRTDFVIQHVKDAVAIECFERIARFHILAVHVFCEPEERTGETDDPVKGFDYRLEVEQMMKSKLFLLNLDSLQSLIQFYDDRPLSAPPSPNEAEFRAYYLLAHIRSTSSLRRLHSLPGHIFNSPILQAALEFQSYSQALSLTAPSTATHKSRTKTATSSLPLQNFFSRFFKRVSNPVTSYLMACLLEFHFGGVRRSAIHALWKAYSTRHRGVPIGEVGVLLGMALSAEHVDEEAVADVVRTFGIRVEEDDGDGFGKRVLLSRVSRFDCECN